MPVERYALCVVLTSCFGGAASSHMPTSSRWCCAESGVWPRLAGGRVDCSLAGAQLVSVHDRLWSEVPESESIVVHSQAKYVGVDFRPGAHSTQWSIVDVTLVARGAEVFS